MKRKIRMGMVGGGRGAFIGAVHRMAAAIDGEIELVCGAFSSNPKKSKLSGADLYLPKDRVYGSYEEMIKKEAELPLGAPRSCVYKYIKCVVIYVCVYIRYNIWLIYSFKQ